MALRSAMDSVFQLQDALLTVGEPTPYRLYRLVLMWRSSYKFELSNYIADSRRRAKFKFCLVQLKSKQSITSQLIPTEQLLFLLWCKSSKTVIISAGSFLSRIFDKCDYNEYDHASGNRPGQDPPPAFVSAMDRSRTTT